LFKSPKSLVIFSAIISLLMISNNMSNIEFTGPASNTTQIGTYLVTFIAVFNTGYFMRQYLDSRRK